MPTTFTVDLARTDTGAPTYRHMSRGSISIRTPTIEPLADKALLAAIAPTQPRCFIRWELATRAYTPSDRWSLGRPLNYNTNANFTLSNSWIAEFNARSTAAMNPEHEAPVLTQEGMADMEWMVIHPNTGFTQANLDTFEDLQYTAFKHYKQTCPRITRVGMLNEPDIKINSGRVFTFDGEQIYRLLKTAIKAVVRVNAELSVGNPSYVPLKVFGPETIHTFPDKEAPAFINAIIADLAWWNSTGKPNMGALTMHAFANEVDVDKLLGPLDRLGRPAGFRAIDDIVEASPVPTLFQGIPRGTTAYARANNGAAEGTPCGDGAGNNEAPSQIVLARQAAFYAAFHDLAHHYIGPYGERFEVCIMFSRSNYVAYENSMIRPIPQDSEPGTVCGDPQNRYRYQLNWVPGARSTVYNLAALEHRIADGQSDGRRHPLIAVEGSEWWASPTDPLRPGLGGNGRVTTITPVTRPGVGKVWVLLARHRINGSSPQQLTVRFAGIDAILDTTQPITYSVRMIDINNSIPASETGVGGEIDILVNNAPVPVVAGLRQVAVDVNDPGVALIELVGTPAGSPPVPPDPPPSVTIVGPTTRFVDQDVDLSIANAGGPITTRSWTATGSPTPATGSGATFSPRWATPGTYTVTLNVTGPGGSSVDTHVVTIEAEPTASGGIVTTGRWGNFGIRHGNVISAVAFRDNSFQIGAGVWPQATAEFLETDRGNRLAMIQARQYNEPTHQRSWIRDYAASLPGPSDRIKAAMNINGLGATGLATIADVLACDPIVNAKASTNGQPAGIDSHLPTDPVFVPANDTTQDLRACLYYVRESLKAWKRLQDENRIDVYVSIMHEMNGNWFLHGWDRASHTDFKRYFRWIAREARHLGLKVSWIISIGPLYVRGLQDNLLRWPGEGFASPGIRSNIDPLTGQQIVDVFGINHYNKVGGARDDQRMFDILVEGTDFALDHGIQFALEEWAAGGHAAVQYLADTHAHVDTLPPPPAAGSLAYSSYFNPSKGGEGNSGGGTEPTYYDIHREPGRTAYPNRAKFMGDLWSWLWNGRPGDPPWEDLTPYGLPGGRARCRDCGPPPPPPPAAPVVEITGPDTVTQGTSATYAYTNTGGAVATLEWTVTTSTSSLSAGLAAATTNTGNGPTFTVSFPEPGIYEVNLEAANVTGTSSDTLIVTCNASATEGIGGAHHMLI